VEGHVSLIVYDALGNQVERLLNKKMLAGWNESIFDGKDLSPGMFVFRLEANGQNITKPMLLMRK
jgi:hypothetical protein